MPTKNAAKKPTEAQVTKAIRATLKLCGVFHWKAWQGPMSTPGVPDIIGVWKGRMLGIEIKSPSGKVTDAQQAFINRINHEGGLAFVARSVDDVISGLGLQDRFLF